MLPIDWYHKLKKQPYPHKLSKIVPDMKAVTIYYLFFFNPRNK